MNIEHRGPGVTWAVCWVKEELKRQVVGGGRGEGDPGIHVHGTRRKLLALTSLATPALQPGALLQAPSTKDRHSQSNLLHFHLAGREGGELKKKKKKSHYLYLCFPSGAAENANWGDSCCELFIFHSEDSVSFYCIQELLI